MDILDYLHDRLDSRIYWSRLEIERLLLDFLRCLPADKQQELQQAAKSAHSFREFLYQELKASFARGDDHHLFYNLALAALAIANFAELRKRYVE